MIKILQKDAKVLREVALEVEQKEITSPKIKKVIAEMKEALRSQDDGVAIAAPQIGYSLRIFIVSSKVSEILKEEKSSTHKSPKQSESDKPSGAKASTDLVFINPVITKMSKEKSNMEEGCLSVRYLYGKVSRAKKTTIEAYDENGKKFSRGGSNILSQIFQHETDHLNGILFIDKAKNLEDLPPVETNRE